MTDHKRTPSPPPLWQTNPEPGTLAAALKKQREDIVNALLDERKRDSGRPRDPAFQHYIQTAHDELCEENSTGKSAEALLGRGRGVDRAKNLLCSSFKENYRILNIIDKLQTQSAFTGVVATEGSIKKFLDDQAFDTKPCMGGSGVIKSALNRAVLEKILRHEGEAAEEIFAAVQSLWAPSTTSLTAASLEVLWTKPRPPQSAAENNEEGSENLKLPVRPLLRTAGDCIRFIELFQLPSDKAAKLMLSYLNYAESVTQHDELTLVAFAAQYKNLLAYMTASQGEGDKNYLAKARFEKLANFYRVSLFFSQQTLSDVDLSRVETTEKFVQDAFERDRGRSMRRVSGFVFDAMLFAAMTEMVLNSPYLSLHFAGVKSAMHVAMPLTGFLVLTFLIGFTFTALGCSEGNRVQMPEGKRKPVPVSSNRWMRAGFFGGSVISGVGVTLLGYTCSSGLRSSNLIISAALILAGTLIRKLAEYRDTASVLYPMDKPNKKTANWGLLFTCLGVTGTIGSATALYFVPNMMMPKALLSISAFCVILGAVCKFQSKPLDLGQSPAQNSDIRYSCFTWDKNYFSGKPLLL